MQVTLKSPVQRYLEVLEAELKQLPGVTPEDALADAYEHLERELAALERAEPGIAADDCYVVFVERYGEPRDVAAAYADDKNPFGSGIPACAPGWRIYCATCGHSSPAATVGITRIGALSTGKRVLGFCRGCRWPRFLRLVKDLDETNLTESQLSIGSSSVAAWTVRKLKALAGVGAVFAILWAVGVFSPQQEMPQVFRSMPEGWKLNKSSVIPARQTNAIGSKLGGKIDRLINAFVAFNGQPVQINVIECPTVADARKLEASLRKTKPMRQLVQRNDTTLYEFVARTQADVRLALAARYELGIQPKRVSYRVTFSAAPTVGGDCMKWNELFNLFLRHEREPSEQTEAEIERASNALTFGNTLKLRRFGIGGSRNKWKFTPAVTSTMEVANGDLLAFRFDQLPEIGGIPSVTVELQLTSETGAATPTDREDVRPLVAGNSRWPVDDDEVRKLAREITGSAKTRRQKLRAILSWFGSNRNIRFGGDITGSRYGVKKVLEQKFGHCWDYSDVFVTLCRAAGVPSRQVFGWLYGSEGHVWAEVLIDGEGWKHVDPTTAAGCGSDYLPFASSEDGEIPLLYTSSVKIEALPLRRTTSPN
ncbi:MAG: transglutaminase family protein [Planctomycetaceae bacterium]